MHTHHYPFCPELVYCTKELCFKPNKVCQKCRRDNWMMFFIVGGTILVVGVIICVYRYFRG